MKQSDLRLDTYIRSASDSTKRSRWVLMILNIASVLALVGFLNSRMSSWSNERLSMSRYITTHYDSITTKTPPLRPDSAYFQLLMADTADTLDIDTQELLQKLPYGYAEEVIDSFGFSKLANYNSLTRHQQAILYTIITKMDKDMAQKSHQAIQRARVERVVWFTVPVLGFPFDINDLGLLSGITFIILLMLFRLRLSREHENLEILFRKAARDGKLRECYDVLSMIQIITVPPIELNIAEKIWRYVPKFLYVMPLFVQALIFYNDKRTEVIGHLYSHFNTTFLINFHWVSMVVILFLTISCLYLSVKIDIEWQQQSDKLQKSVLMLETEV